MDTLYRRDEPHTLFFNGFAYTGDTLQEVYNIFVSLRSQHPTARGLIVRDSDDETVLTHTPE